MSSSETGALSRKLQALSLPLGEYRITRDVDNAICRLTGLPETTGPLANPLLFSVASLAGLGISIEDLCKVCNFDYRDGPMIGGCLVRFAKPLKVDETYDVQTNIVSLERKTGKKIGAMDLLKFMVTLVEKSGEKACEINYTWILPRGKIHAESR